MGEELGGVDLEHRRAKSSSTFHLTFTSGHDPGLGHAAPFRSEISAEYSCLCQLETK